MFKVFTNGYGFAFNFRYNSDENNNRSVTCFIKDDDDQVVSLGTSLCHEDQGDHFEKAKGRKLALKHALKKCGFDKYMRRSFWETYKLRCGV